MLRTTISAESTVSSTLASPYIRSSGLKLSVGFVDSSVTITLTSTVSSPNVTVIVVSPLATPVTTPFSSTVAIEGSADSKVQPSLLGLIVSVSPTSTSITSFSTESSSSLDLSGTTSG